MKIISHRGNISGADCENDPLGVLEALRRFEAEIDLWSIEGKLFLGHDFPQYPIDEQFVFNEKLWIHCKNLEAVEVLSGCGTKAHYFFHDRDLMTLTSQNIPWCNYGVYVKGGITVEGPPHAHIKKDILGICTDFPNEWLCSNEKGNIKRYTEEILEGVK